MMDEIPVLMQIGKNGMTDNVITELKEHLKRRKIIKVKFLGNFMKGKDKGALIQELADRTGSTLVKCVGFVCVLKKK